MCHPSKNTACCAYFETHFFTLLGSKYPDIVSRVMPNPSSNQEWNPPTSLRDELLDRIGLPFEARIILVAENINYGKAVHRIRGSFMLAIESWTNTSHSAPPLQEFRKS